MREKELNSESECRHVGTLTQGRRLFSEAAHCIIPGGDSFLAISFRRRFTSGYRLPLSEQLTPEDTNEHAHTHMHHPPAPHPTFDHLSQDVYGPLFAVLMIIVTG